MGQSTLSAYFPTETPNGTIMLPISSAGSPRMPCQRHQGQTKPKGTSNREPSLAFRIPLLPVQSLITS